MRPLLLATLLCISTLPAARASCDPRTFTRSPLGEETATVKRAAVYSAVDIVFKKTRTGPELHFAYKVSGELTGITRLGAPLPFLLEDGTVVALENAKPIPTRREVLGDAVFTEVAYVFPLSRDEVAKFTRSPVEEVRLPAQDWKMKGGTAKKFREASACLHAS